jgi:plasmid stability protein
MTNLTITVDEETLKKARIRALEQGTSVNAVLRDFLESYAGVRRERREALQRIIQSSRESVSGSGPEGRTWRREDAYEERLGRYGRE